jgi:hypothetical protein
MASYYRKSGGAGDGTGDETDRSIDRRMKNMGKSGPESDHEETRDRDGDCSESSDEYDLNSKVKGEKKKKTSSRFRSRSSKRARAQGTPSGVTPNSKEPRMEPLPELRVGLKIDVDGNLVKPSREREEAIRRAQEDKERRFIAAARPHRPSGGERGGGGGLDSSWLQQRSRNNRDDGRNNRDDGRNNRDRGRTTERTGKNNFIKHKNSNPGAVNEAAAARKSNSFGDSASTSGAAQVEKTRPMARKTPDNPDNSDSDPDKELTKHFSAPERITAKSNNPSFAAMMVKHLARAEETIYVFSGTEEQNPLTLTHWQMILANIQEQSLTLQIQGKESPEYKSANFSQQNDKGFLGVASPEMADLIVQAVSRITIEGVRFRGWRSAELQTKHLVTVEIRPELAGREVTKIIHAMMIKNNLKGEVLSAWISPGELPSYKVLKFFANDQLHAELLERRNGDMGWNIFLYVRSQHSKAHISQQPGAQAAAVAAAVAEAAELKTARDKKDAAVEAERVAKAMADWEAGKVERAAREKARAEAANTMDQSNNAKSDAQKREEAEAARIIDDEEAALLQGDMDTDTTKK